MKNYETSPEYAEIRAIVEEELRESHDYECELALEVKEELSMSFREFWLTEEYCTKKQEARQSIRDRCEFDSEAYDVAEWEKYRADNHDYLEERLREPYEAAFQQKVDEAMA